MNSFITVTVSSGIIRTRAKFVTRHEHGANFFTHRLRDSSALSLTTAAGFIELLRTSPLHKPVTHTTGLPSRALALQGLLLGFFSAILKQACFEIAVLLTHKLKLFPQISTCFEYFKSVDVIKVDLSSHPPMICIPTIPFVLQFNSIAAHDFVTIFTVSVIHFQFISVLVTDPDLTNMIKKGAHLGLACSLGRFLLILITNRLHQV